MTTHGAAEHGGVLHSARAYDLLVWVLTLGRERRFRDHLLDLAHADTGESVLDVGCGTGALAIAARDRVGPGGEVCGVDPSPEMVGPRPPKGDQGRRHRPVREGNRPGAPLR